MIIKENEPLSKYTSLHVGGPAQYLAVVTSDEELLEALKLARAVSLPFFILGKGSNTLFDDTGYSGVVIVMRDQSIEADGNNIRASSGVFMRQLVTFALQHSLRGLEELAGIPGTVGGAVRGNAGTWNTEIKDVIESAEVLLPSPAGGWEKRSLSVRECEFRYRDSVFKRRRDWVIVRAVFSLMSGDPHEGKKLVAQDLRRRHEKQPYDAPSAGSIFKNPDKKKGVYSGALIEQAGLKGLSVGGAQISPKHANFIVNRGSATSADIRSLMRKAQEEVLKRTGIRLEPEIEVVES